MNRTYEIMFIVRPDVEEAELDKLIEGFSANVTHGGGEVKSVEKMGRRRLAYTVRKFNDGFYVLLKPLPVGHHTLHFHAESPAGVTVGNVTYNLTVVPVLLK